MNSVNSLRRSHTPATFRVGIAIGVCVCWEEGFLTKDRRLQQQEVLVLSYQLCIQRELERGQKATPLLPRAGRPLPAYLHN